jgi:hypothetical protein
MLKINFVQDVASDLANDQFLSRVFNMLPDLVTRVFTDLFFDSVVLTVVTRVFNPTFDGQYVRHD